MHNAIVATVGFLLLSVAALPAPAAGAGTDGGVETAATGQVAPTGTAIVAASSATAPSAQRARLLALPGLDSIGAAVLLVVGGFLGLLLAAGALWLGRDGSAAADRPSADASAERGDGNGIPATSPAAEGGTADGRSPAVRTDEEYVVQLLIANHGRMRQARIVEETDWSKAKVSRLLSRMEEREQVVRERAGREKIVQLADANTSIPL